MPDLSSAEVSRLSKRMEDLLSCPVCFEPCDPPKILKYCGHFFCLRCLTAIYAKAETKGTPFAILDLSAAGLKPRNLVN
jgi:hypothetical protein